MKRPVSRWGSRCSTGCAPLAVAPHADFRRPRRSRRQRGTSADDRPPYGGARRDVGVLRTGHVIRYQRGTMTEWITDLEAFSDPNADVRAVVSSWLALAYTQEGRIDDSRRLLEAFVSTGLQATDPGGGVASSCDSPKSRRSVSIGSLHGSCSIWPRRLPTRCRTPDRSPTDRSVTPRPRWRQPSVTMRCPMDTSRGRPRSTTVPAPSSTALERTSGGPRRSSHASAGDTDRARTLLKAAHTAACLHGYKDIERRSAEALVNLT